MSAYDDYVDERYGSLIDWAVPPGNVIDGGRPVRMTGVRDTDAQDRELTDIYGIEATP